MGGCLSSESSRKASYNKIIRVVHLNGNLKFFEPPVMVRQVIATATNNPSNKYFLCTAKQRLTSGSKSLKPDTVLEPGVVYFLLPYSILRADVSPVDMAVLVRQLSRKTKKVEQLESRFPLNGSFSARRGVTSPICASPARSFPSSPGRMSPCRSPGRAFDSNPLGIAFEVGGGGRRSWRPNLDPIREKSFNRRSESDLQEQQSMELSATRPPYSRSLFFGITSSTQRDPTPAVLNISI